MKYTPLIILLFFTSCLSKYYTNEGGVRVKNPKVFKYNRSRFIKMNKGLIDTSAIYLMDSSYNKYGSPVWQRSGKTFARFFGSGEVLFIYCDSFPCPGNINNPNTGIPGYFIVKDTKIRIDMYQELNGGQTGKRFGRIRPNGDIIFYDQRPETYFSCFSCMEKAERNTRFSIWKKVPVDTIKYYQPDW
jgi:hypothetical protein